MSNTEPTANPTTKPMPPSTAWEEKREPDEEDMFSKFAQYIKEQQEKLLKEEPKIAQRTKGQLLRGFHAKPHAGLEAEFEVLADLPEHARYGVFAEPRVFPAVVRFSNGTPTLQSDRKPEPRGIGIKLFGVQGKKLLEDQKHAVTQDFLATSHSVTSTVKHVRQFIAFVKAGEDGMLKMPYRLARAVGLKEARRILWALLRTVILPKVRSMATEVYAGTAPIKLGPYAVKFTVRPAEDTAPPPKRRPWFKPDFLREELAGRLRKSDLNFDFVVQFFVDEQLTPIEDTSVRWEPEVAPFVKVARLRIPRCELDQTLTDKVNQLSFTPWHATEDHRPLGNVMRARRFAYEASSAHRGRSQEPTGLPL
ncbi:MAG TPA: catalase family protein [Pyrinomonadaceae bacterium]